MVQGIGPGLGKTITKLAGRVPVATSYCLQAQERPRWFSERRGRLETLGFFGDDSLPF